MKILIAYDGSGTARTMLNDLRLAGLPKKVDTLIISISEMWLSPQSLINDYAESDDDVAEYFQLHSEQINRNLASTEEFLAKAKDELQKYFPQWNIKTETKLSNSAADEILLKSSEFSPDLLVFGSQGLSWDGHRRLGSISQKVLTEANCSVRLARTKRDTNPRHLKIAICFDGSEGSLQSVKTVASRCWQFIPEIRLLTVTDPLIALIPGRAFQVIPGLPEGRMKGEQILVEAFAEKAFEIFNNSGLYASLEIYSGNPRLVLPNETDNWGADLIFIGANSDLLQKDSIGSVASAVATRSSCTVEVVK